VYQSRHPQVREYISEVCSLLGKEVEKGTARRVTIVIKNTSGLPLERWIFDLGYLNIAEGREREAGLVGAPGTEELSLMLRGFLIKLTSLDGQLEDIKRESVPRKAVFEVCRNTADK
jgi:mitotic spindle assembly checkpoint protein MAD2B